LPNKLALTIMTTLSFTCFYVGRLSYFVWMVIKLVKAQTSLVQFVYTTSCTTNPQLSTSPTTCRTINPQQIEQVEFELNLGVEQPPSTCQSSCISQQTSHPIGYMNERNPLICGSKCTGWPRTGGLTRLAVTHLVDNEDFFVSAPFDFAATFCRFRPARAPAGFRLRRL
jgi:hypothetical protein